MAITVQKRRFGSFLARSAIASMARKNPGCGFFVFKGVLADTFHMPIKREWQEEKEKSSFLSRWKIFINVLYTGCPI